jgi:hypothetical protein
MSYVSGRFLHARLCTCDAMRRQAKRAGQRLRDLKPWALDFRWRCSFCYSFSAVLFLRLEFLVCSTACIDALMQLQCRAATSDEMLQILYLHSTAHGAQRVLFVGFLARGGTIV